MPHPDGGEGGVFPARRTFAQTFVAVGPAGVKLVSTTGEPITARQGVAIRIEEIGPRAPDSDPYWPYEKELRTHDHYPELC